MSQYQEDNAKIRCSLVLLRSGRLLREVADAEEDKAFGKDRRGDEMPAWRADKEKRLAKIREAKAALEAEAKAAAETKVKAGQEAEEKRNRGVSAYVATGRSRRPGGEQRGK